MIDRGIGDSHEGSISQEYKYEGMNSHHTQNRIDGGEVRNQGNKLPSGLYMIPS